MLFEMFLIVTFTKQGVNWWRVLTNAKMESHAIMSPVSEMMMFQVAEVFSESIPMTVIQLDSILREGR